MADLWPWLALAGVGALHGLSPANGWMFAAACGVRSGDAAHARRALQPIAVGHLASIVVVAWTAAQGLSIDRALTRDVAGALLVASAAFRLWRGSRQRASFDTRSGHAGIAAWSFLMATSHGAGLMLLPALASLCGAEAPAREITASGSLLLAAAAVGVHMTSMLVTTGVLAGAACRGLALRSISWRTAVLQRTWTAALAIAGVSLLALP